MKQYKKYMDSVKVSDALHQRLLELEAPKRPPAWARYGAWAAALALAAGVGAAGLARYGAWEGLAERIQTGPGQEDARLDDRDIAPEAPGGVAEPGEKTLGGYDVTVGNSPGAMTARYVLPYIDYGGMKPSAASSMQMAADWDIPRGAVRRDLTWDEIITLMGGEDAVNTHLDWGMYALTGWAAWNEDGSLWGAYINGLLPNYDGPTSRFEFAVTAGQLPPTCIAYAESVTQEIRGLTVTADGHDSVAGPEGGEDASTRRVSFMKDGYGYRFDLTGTSRALTEERVSRLVARIADKGLELSALQAGGSYTCPDCGQTFPVDNLRAHVHSFTGVGEPNWEEGFEYSHWMIRDGDLIGDPVAPAKFQSAPPTLRVLCPEGHADTRSGNYEWTHIDPGGGEGQGVTITACGAHPLEFRDAPGLTTGAGTAALSFPFNDLPGQVSAVCWPDSEWGNPSAGSQAAGVSKGDQTCTLTLKNGGWVYEVTAQWDTGEGWGGTASYVFHIVGDGA